MKKLIISISALLMGLAASAASETTIRLPVLIVNTDTEKVTPAAYMKALGLPETVILSGRTDASQVMSQLSKKIKDGRYEISAYGTIRHYLENLEVRLKLCYVGNPHQAIDIVNGLSDSFLSDQLQLNFYRASGDTHFRRTYHHSKSDELVKVGDDDYVYIQKYMKLRLKPGQIQTLTAYSDDGDDTSVDIIEHCK